ncbi:uncharacterized protein [Dysidea avara]|uniref:uncharacterized protein n=1 Tax=Dysidea avara TaxID=196820 RepID=UPI00332D13F4
MFNLLVNQYGMDPSKDWFDLYCLAILMDNTEMIDVFIEQHGMSPSEGKGNVTVANLASMFGKSNVVDLLKNKYGQPVPTQEEQQKYEPLAKWVAEHMTKIT